MRERKPREKSEQCAHASDNDIIKRGELKLNSGNNKVVVVAITDGPELGKNLVPLPKGFTSLVVICNHVTK